MCKNVFAPRMTDSSQNLHISNRGPLERCRLTLSGRQFAAGSCDSRNRHHTSTLHRFVTNAYKNSCTPGTDCVGSTYADMFGHTPYVVWVVIFIARRAWYTSQHYTHRDTSLQVTRSTKYAPLSLTAMCSIASVKGYENSKKRSGTHHITQCQGLQ